jgi:hypothetical protein
MPDEIALGDDAADAFYADMMGTKKEPKEAPEEPVEASVEDTGTTEAKDAFKASDDEPEAPVAEEHDPDDDEVEWGADDAKVKAKMRDLKESYAQKAKYEADSVKFAETRARVENDGQRATVALNKMLEKAQARWQPYSELDFLVLAQQLDPESLAAIRKDAVEALNDVKFLTSELDGTVKARQQASQQQYQAAIQASVKELSDPTTGIPGFGKDLYEQIVQHTHKTTGTSPEQLRTIIAPWAVKMMHKAMLYDKAASKVTVQATKVVHRPTKVLTGTGKTPPAAAGDAKTRTMNALRKSGTQDAAADAFLALLGGGSDE